MSDENFKRYLIDSIKLLKKQALEAKKEADNPKKSSKDYAKGAIMGYYSIINLLKHQAFVFCIDQKELGLADIKPDVDLLGLHRNLDRNFEEDNWVIDVVNEEKIKRYLIDSIKLLKKQAIEAKKEADNPKKGSEDYSKGEVMAYHQAISTMKDQALLFDLGQEEFSLSSIDPDRDLIC